MCSEVAQSSSGQRLHTGTYGQQWTTEAEAEVSAELQTVEMAADRCAAVASDQWVHGGMYSEVAQCSGMRAAHSSTQQWTAEVETEVSAELFAVEMGADRCAAVASDQWAHGGMCSEVVAQ